MHLIQTASGNQVDLLDPDPETITLKDIAHALTHEPRFNGHTKSFYSVAQHSLFVSSLCPIEHAAEGLLHDATEAYIKDIPTPLKSLLPDYKIIENKLDSVIRVKFGLPPKPTDTVKQADRTALTIEALTMFHAPNLFQGPNGQTPTVDREINNVKCNLEYFSTFKFLDPVTTRLLFINKAIALGLYDALPKQPLRNPFCRI